MVIGLDSAKLTVLADAALVELACDLASTPEKIVPGLGTVPERGRRHGSKYRGADVNLAWPTAQAAMMGAQGREHPLLAETDVGSEVGCKELSWPDYEEHLATRHRRGARLTSNR